MAATQMIMIGISISSSSSSSYLLHRSISRSMGPVKTHPSRSFTKTKLLQARASKPKPEEQENEENNNNTKSPFSSPVHLINLRGNPSRQRPFKKTLRALNAKSLDTNKRKEDLNYLWRLGVGSFGGAAVIKYGSILLPEITRPNIILALIMISAPMFVAVLLLIKQSRIKEQN